MIDNHEGKQKILLNLKRYVLYVMQRDIPHINLNYRIKLADCIIKYIEIAQSKGYITDRNFDYCLKRIVYTSSNFNDISDKPYLYGNVLGDCTEFNFSNSWALNNMEHVLFHELTHSITFLDYCNNQNLGFYGYRSISHKNKGIKIRNKSIKETIIAGDFLKFLTEIMAEPTACDLLNSYRPSKEEWGECKLKSDWVIQFNCDYQELGYDFLKTLMTDEIIEEREAFKKFTKDAINDNDNVCSKILRVYEEKHPDTWKDDLHEITTILGKIVNRIIVDEDIKRVKKLMRKYITAKEKSHITIRNRTDNFEEEPPKKSHKKRY